MEREKNIERESDTQSASSVRWFPTRRELAESVESIFGKGIFACIDEVLYEMIYRKPEEVREPDLVVEVRHKFEEDEDES